MERTEKKYINVTEFNSYLKSMFIAEEMLHNVFVIGEISDLKIKNNIAFFVLKDENCSMSCTAFDFHKLYQPQNGELVILHGFADFYLKTGKLSFRVMEITAAGKGLLNINFELAKKRLADAGYFAQEHKKCLPKYIYKVAIITSHSGAVIHDFISTVRSKNNLLNIDVYEAMVQGSSASKSIITALNKADKLSYDAIVIARGGGSAEDLAPFNDEQLVKAIFDAKTPVISAVGHETDYTLCDLVADVRVPTPTAAAELVAFNEKLLLNTFYEYADTLTAVINDKLSNLNFVSCNLAEKLSLRISAIIDNSKVKLYDLMSNMVSLSNSNLGNKAHTAQLLAAKLDGNNPAKIFSSGYYKIFKNDKSVSRLSELCMGDVINIFDGKNIAEAKITNFNEEK